jgi:hypothetical protein
MCDILVPSLFFQLQLLYRYKPGSCEHTLNTLRYAYRVKELRSEGGSKGRKVGGCTAVDSSLTRITRKHLVSTLEPIK